MKKLLPLLLMAMIGVLLIQVHAETIYWTGSSSGKSGTNQWTNAANWSPGTPTTTSDLVFDAGHSPFARNGSNNNPEPVTSFNTLTLVSTSTVASISILSSATISSANAASIGTSAGTFSGSVIAGALSVGAQTLTFAGSSTNVISSSIGTASIPGTISTNGGNVILTGTWNNTTGASATIQNGTGTVTIGDGITHSSGTNSGPTSITNGTLVGAISSNLAIFHNVTVADATISGGTLSGTTTITGTSSLLGTNAGNYATTITGAANSNNGWVILAGNATTINAGGSLAISGRR